MFKLIKILNSGVNVPETVRLTKSSLDEIYAGIPVRLESGVVTVCDIHDKPTHMTVQHAEAGTNTVMCHEVSPNMIFETYFNEAPEELYIGSKTSFAQDNNDMPGCIDYAENAGGSVTIVDMPRNASAGDKVSVKFN